MSQPTDPPGPYPPPVQYPPPPQFSATQYTPPVGQYPVPAVAPAYPPGPSQYPPVQSAGQPVPPGQYAPAPQYAPPPQYAPTQQYAPAHYGPPPQYAPQYGPAAQLNGVVCRICGAGPAIKGTVRGHRGMIVVMQFRSIKGPFCRNCGLASLRKLCADTLWQGWWGYFSAIATPVVLLINLVFRLRLAGLHPPTGGTGPSLDPGKPLYQRPAILGALIPLAVLVLIVWIATTS